jgi:hypothetical protein
MRYVEPRFFEERIESDSLHPGSMVLVRPRSSEYDVRDLEREIRTLQLERQGGIEITRERETDRIDSNGNEEEITELSRSERRRMCPGVSCVRFYTDGRYRTEFPDSAGDVCHFDVIRGMDDAVLLFSSVLMNRSFFPSSQDVMVVVAVIKIK